MKRNYRIRLQISWEVKHCNLIKRCFMCSRRHTIFCLIYKIIIFCSIFCSIDLLFDLQNIHFLFVSWQPCNHFNVTFKVLPTNVTNVSPLPTTKLKHVSFFSFFPNKIFQFFVKIFGFYCRFKVIFVSSLINSVAPTFSTFLKVRHDDFLI